MARDRVRVGRDDQGNLIFNVDLYFVNCYQERPVVVYGAYADRLEELIDAIFSGASDISNPAVYGGNILLGSEPHQVNMGTWHSRKVETMFDTPCPCCLKGLCGLAEPCQVHGTWQDIYIEFPMTDGSIITVKSCDRHPVRLEWDGKTRTETYIPGLIPGAVKNKVTYVKNESGTLTPITHVSDDVYANIPTLWRKRFNVAPHQFIKCPIPV